MYLKSFSLSKSLEIWHLIEISDFLIFLRNPSSKQTNTDQFPKIKNHGYIPKGDAQFWHSDTIQLVFFRITHVNASRNIWFHVY